MPLKASEAPDPSHPEHDERVEWVGGVFDLARFDLEEVNKGPGEEGLAATASLGGR